MNEHLSHLLLLSLSLTLLPAAAAVDFLFNGFGPSDVSLYGDTTNPSRVISLTNRLPFSLGRAIYPSKIPTKRPNSSAVLPFSTSFIFSMAPFRGALPGHGILFVFVPTPGILESASAQHLGLFNRTSNGDPRSHVFGVEFDVFQNEEFGDINGNHVGVDVNSLESVRACEAGFWPDNGRKFKKLKLNNGRNYQVWIDYVNSVVNVTMAPAGLKRPNRPLLSFPLNLSDVLQDEMYVGFAAATGALTQSHLILAWSFSNTNFSLGQGLVTRGLPNFEDRTTPVTQSSGFIVGMITGVMFSVLLCCVVVCWLRRRDFRMKKAKKEEMEQWELEYWPHRIGYRVIESATNNFSNENVIGGFGNGKVYRGKLTGGLEVAVKRLSCETFLAEISSLGRLKHRNLVGLRGWCKKEKEGGLFVVYDYMENGSLDKRVFECDDFGKILSFEERIRILKQIASGVSYLHHEWESTVLHRDIKSSNVLLDKQMNAKLGDFGLARIHNHDKADDPTRVVGTIGYLAPEVVKNGKVSTKTDVFSYGVLILEVICGRRPIEEGKPLLVNWLLELLRRGELVSGVDSRLRANNGEFDEEKAEQMLQLGLLCAHTDSSVRPTMRQVVKLFAEEAEIDEPEEDDEGRCILEKMKDKEILCSSVSISWSHSFGVGRYLIQLLLCLSTTIPAVRLTSAVDFLFNGFNSSDASLYGDADIKSHVLALTNDVSSSNGRAFYPYQIHTKQPNSSLALPFSTSFIFSMAPSQVGVVRYGFVFYFVPGGETLNSSSARQLGLFNSSGGGPPNSHIFAVEFDVYRNSLFRSIDDGHLGVDLGSIVSISADGAGYWADDDVSSFKHLSFNDGKNYQAWIDYVDGVVNVTIAPVELKRRPNRPWASVPLNLSRVLLDEMHVGFIGGTYRSFFGSQRILAWSFSNTNFSLSEDLINEGLPNFAPRQIPNHKTRGSVSVSGITVVALLLILLCFAFVVVIFLKKRIKRIKMKREGIEHWELEYWPHRISYREIESATNNFAEENVIGIGGNGKEVYKGIFPGGSLVAVKRLSRENSESVKAFSAEVSSLGRLKHRNLVGLRGWCKKEKDMLFVVYDYMENGSLDKRVFECDDSKMLSCEERMRILKEIASGVSYLHHGWESKVLHRDIKASNVLLDEQMNARLGDFGLAWIHNRDKENDPTRVVGTIGYLAPEVVKTGKVSTQTDVFSYGVLILEVICGRRPIEHGESFLVDWLLELLRRGELINGVDPRVRANGEFDEEEVERMIQLGLLCAHPDASVRPTMRQVVKFFEEKAEIDEPEDDEGRCILEKMKDKEILCSSASISWSHSFGVGRYPIQLLLCLSTTILAVRLTSAVDFLFNGFNSSDASLYGDADIKSHVLTLTNDVSSSNGRAFYPYQIHTKQPNSSLALPFSTSFIFSMAPSQVGVIRYGFLFYFVPGGVTLNSSSASQLGLFNSSGGGRPNSHVFGVEFDAYRNSLFLSNDDGHLGVDVGSIISISADQAGYWPDDDDSSFKPLSFNDGKNYQAWIDYVDGMVNVTIAPVELKRRPNWPLFSVPLNLSRVLLDEMHVGFIGGTYKSFFGSHRILAWSFSNTNFSLSEDLINEGLPNFAPPNHRTRGSASVSGMIVVALSLILLCFAFVVVILLKKRIKRIKMKKEGIEHWELEYWPHRISYREIESATNNFAEENVIGIGVNGKKVYKGIFPGGSLVAIKCLSRENSESVKAFSAEVSSLGRLKHRNLVGLRGWCKKEKDTLFVVYDYMEHGSLDKRVFECDDSTMLSCEERMRILKEIASGVSYLHHGWESKVLHRDIKASNVLLDEQMNARLGDFGLAWIHNRDNENDIDPTRVVGTIGYLAPEVVKTGKVSTKTDVFSYGVLILEVICGRRPIEEGKPFLVDWLLELLRRGELISGVDPRFWANGEIDEEKVERMIQLGLLCAHPDASVRPTMRQVVKFFEEKTEIDEPEDDEGRCILEKMKDKEIFCSLASISWSHSFGVGR
ncbi:lectin protein kinase [Striga asiatica]|uniref:non-specific serine/threonine protein kinase n=1 Tax=Striga asiatica TaxID=4170 RepID=A0A5A7PUV6_STRAF|nr:lectin protein kinase [Striga asiatica]